MRNIITKIIKILVFAVTFLTVLIVCGTMTHLLVFIIVGCAAFAVYLCLFFILKTKIKTLVLSGVFSIVWYFICLIITNSTFSSLYLLGCALFSILIAVFFIHQEEIPDSLIIEIFGFLSTLILCFCVSWGFMMIISLLYWSLYDFYFIK